MGFSLAMNTSTRVFTKELLSEGLWSDNKGNLVDIRQGDLQAIVATSPRDVPVKLGHTSSDFNDRVADKLRLPVELLTGDAAGRGQMRLGKATNYRVEGDRLLADIELPDALADMVDQNLLVNVSAELQRGSPYSISAVALLGVERPAVSNLREFGLDLGDQIILLSKQERHEMADMKETISAAIKALQGLLDEGSGETEGEDPNMGEDPEVEIKLPMEDKEDDEMSAKLQEQMNAMQGQLTALSTRLANSEKEKAELQLAQRQSHFLTVAQGLPHIQDKEAWASQMSTLELSQADQVEDIIAAHRSAADAQKTSVLFQRTSVTQHVGAGADGDHPFLAKVREEAAAGSLNLSDRQQYATAFTRASDNNRQEFLDYQQSISARN